MGFFNLLYVEDLKMFFDQLFNRTTGRTLKTALEKNSMMSMAIFIY
jgi:hypothetical protein